ncbi:MAG: glycosyltransferase family 2 protein [Armatimonadota bacterium]
MNILLIVPTLSVVDSARADWREQIRAGDTVNVLSLVQSPSTRDDGTLYHVPCALNTGQAFFARVRRRLLRLHPRRSSPLWRRVIREFQREIASELQAFDPDLIDLRWLPDRQLFTQLIARDAKYTIVSEGEPPPRSAIDTCWRRYDPQRKVSIVLPVYNGANYLRAALMSCLAQTHRALEVIVVDDCSTDETPAIIAEFAHADSRVIAVRNTHNLRLPRALNAGFACATGELLTWTSHDNYYAPTAIERLVRYLCTWPAVDFVYADYFTIDTGGITRARIPVAPPPYLRVRNPVGAYFLYRREVYERVGEFRPEREYAEDYEYWVRVYQQGFTMQCLHAPLYYYRHHEASMTGSAKDNRIQELTRQVQRDYFSDGSARNHLV